MYQDLELMDKGLKLINMDRIYYQLLKTQKQPHGVIAKIDLLMNRNILKKFQGQVNMIQVIIMEVNIYYQHIEVTALENIEKIQMYQKNSQISIQGQELIGLQVILGI